MGEGRGGEGRGGEDDYHRGIFLVNSFSQYFFETSWIARVVSVELVLPFIARQDHLASVDNHHMVSHVHCVCVCVSVCIDCTRNGRCVHCIRDVIGHSLYGQGARRN